MTENHEYWATKEDIVSDLKNKVENYYRDLTAHDHLYRMKKSYAYYFGYGYEAQSDRILEAGSQGELSRLSVNHYRNLLKSILTLVTSNRPAFDVRPINTDYKSQTQAILGEQILDYYFKEKKIENILKDATEYALRWGEGFIVMGWDANKGEPYAVDPENDKAIMNGDIQYYLRNPLDVARDVYKEGDQDWYQVRTFVNKYDLMAQFPEHESEIDSLDINIESRGSTNCHLDLSDDSDLVPVWEFYHRKSNSLPEGRYVKYVGDIKLIDSALPYDEVPIYRIADSNFEGTCLGYSPGFDLLGLQETSDELISAVISNNIAFANQIVLIPKDADVNINQFGEGLTIIEYDQESGKIEPLTLVNSSPETYKLIDQLQTLMQMLSGINDVVRGDPKASLRSGNALALVAAQAIQFNSGLQHSYTRLLEDVGTATIGFLKKFAHAPRYVAIVGKYNRSKMREFKDEDLKYINRVFVDVVNPLAKTVAGRLELAENLMNAGMIKRPEQYLSMIESGNLHSMIEAEQAEILLIKGENEKLQEGQASPVMITDDHRLHILEHKAVLADPDVRNDPKIVEAVTEHMQQHIEIWRQADSVLLGALQQQPIAQAPQEGGATMQPNEKPQDQLAGMPELPQTPEGTPHEMQESYNQMTANTVQQ